MANVYFFSGPCGCGKTTLSNAYAKHLVNDLGKNQVYIIHGDDIRGGFVDSEKTDKYSEEKLSWEEILDFNWECILQMTENALKRELDVIIDYVIEDELPLVKAVCEKYSAELYYVVLTASEESITERIQRRGDTWMVDRALFLKNKLENLKTNIDHLFDNSDMTVEEEISRIDMGKFRL